MISTRNMYYGDPEKFDLQKMRADAHRYSVGDKHNDPQNVIVHHHVKESRCELEIKGIEPIQKHETFTAAKEKGQDGEV